MINERDRHIWRRRLTGAGFFAAHNQACTAVPGEETMASAMTALMRSADSLVCYLLMTRLRTPARISVLGEWGGDGGGD